MSEHATETGFADAAHCAARRLALVVLLFTCIFTNLSTRSQNVASRIAAVESFVNRGEFFIDGGPFLKLVDQPDGSHVYLLNDMVYNRRDGRFYSSKPPVLTVMLAGVAAPLKALGARLEFWGPDMAGTLFLLTWPLMGGTAAVAFYAFRRKLASRLDSPDADIVTVLALGGTLFLTYSVTLNHHTITAMLVLVSFFVLGMADGEQAISGKRAAVAGFLMGLAATIDIGHGFAFALAFGLYMLFYMRSVRTIVMFGLGSIAPLACHCALQYPIWGSVLPVQMIEGTKDFPHSYWRTPIGPDAWRVPAWKYWFITLISMRGLFVLSPVLVFGAAQLVADVRDCAQKKLARTEAGKGYAAASVLFGIVFLIAYYALVADRNFGGSCYGMRWYIGFMPLLAWYAAMSYTECRGEARVRRLFYVLGVISVAYALVGMADPWMLMENNPHPLVRALMPLRGF
jgi:hypothetical protein